jgi:hypothetical protein
MIKLTNYGEATKKINTHAEPLSKDPEIICCQTKVTESYRKGQPCDRLAKVFLGDNPYCKQHALMHIYDMVFVAETHEIKQRKPR